MVSPIVAVSDVCFDERFSRDHLLEKSVVDKTTATLAAMLDASGECFINLNSTRQLYAAFNLVPGYSAITGS
jgi:hypothetical protein